MYVSFEELVQAMIKVGYIDENLKPLKCSCGCKNFEEINQYYENHWKIEYQLKCKDCGTIVGHWAYGYWQP